MDAFYHIFPCILRRQKLAGYPVKGVLDLGQVVHIKLENMKLTCGIIGLEVVEVAGVPCCSDDDLAFVQQELSHKTADTSRRPGD